MSGSKLSLTYLLLLNVRANCVKKCAANFDSSQMKQSFDALCDLIEMNSIVDRTMFTLLLSVGSVHLRPLLNGYFAFSFRRNTMLTVKFHGKLILQHKMWFQWLSLSFSYVYFVMCCIYFWLCRNIWGIFEKDLWASDQ